MPDPDTLIPIAPAVGGDSDPFSLWRFAGTKSLVHDGRRLLLSTRLGRRAVRLALALTLEEGMAYAFAIPPGGRRRQRWQAADDLAAALQGTASKGRSLPVTKNMLVHMRALQALDAEAAGATELQLAELIFGETMPAEEFNDSRLRAHVRYLLKVGARFRDGGYRELLQPGTPKLKR